MTKILVLGIGSPFGDDTLGWLAIDRLSNNVSLQSHMPAILQFEKLDRPGVSLLFHLKDAEIVIIIDAIVSNGKIGKIHRLTKEALVSNNSIISSHNISVAEALALGDRLNILPKEIILYGIEIEKNLKLDSYIEHQSSVFSAFINKIQQEIEEIIAGDCAV